MNRTLARLGRDPISALPAPAENIERPSIAALFSRRYAAVTVLLTVAYFAQIMFFYYIQKWIPKIVVDMGFDAAQAGRVLVFANIGNLLGALTIGLASQRFSLRPLVIGAMLTGVAAIAAFGLTGADLIQLSVFAAIAAFFINAGVVGMYPVLAQTYPADAARQRHGLRDRDRARRIGAGTGDCGRAVRERQQPARGLPGDGGRRTDRCDDGDPAALGATVRVERAMRRHAMRNLMLAALLATAPAPGQAETPSAATIDANRRAAQAARFADRRDFDFAARGYLGTRADPVIRTADGRVAIDLAAFDFLKGEAPPSANPSLWRQSQLTAMHGLFRVTDHIYQIRGFDTANMTFVRGQKGWVVIDALTNIETARAAYDLVSEKLGRRPITALIYTHSHGDHFGGAEGLKPYLAAGAPVLAPAGFLEAAISESVIAGPAMSRRAAYQFGMPLAQGPQANVGVGIGPMIARGTRGMLAPSAEIGEDGREMVIDGVRLAFHLTPHTEAPAEMNIFFPEWGVLDLAENANPTQHNILTPRGALIRSAKDWAEGLSEALHRFGGATILITSHGWPRFGAAEVADFIAKHRDAYAFLHDQTVRLMNKGHTGEEIAARLRLPPSLEVEWYNRPYYGSLSFNARAVYQYYMGWYDANPVRLAPLAPEEGGRRYVEAMGGAARVRGLAELAYAKGDYAWAAELLNRVVFASREDKAARLRLAQCYEQLAWQSENSLARNIYLTGALELRGGPAAPSRPGDGGFLTVLPTSDLFAMLATRIDPVRAGDARLRIRFDFTDRTETVTATVANGVLTHRIGDTAGSVDATVTGARPKIIASILTGAALEAKLAGDAEALERFTGWLDQPDPSFAIVTP